MHGNMVTFQGERNYCLAKTKFGFWVNWLKGNVLIWACQNISVSSDTWKLNFLNKMFLTNSVVFFFFTAVSFDRYK